MRRRVLVVDDSRLLSLSLARLLEDSFLVDTCMPSGAVDRLTNERFDVVVTDLLMPGTTGVQLYRWIRVNQTELAARVVFMTGLDKQAAAQMLYGISNPVLGKPFPGADLINAIELVLSNR